MNGVECIYWEHAELLTTTARHQWRVLCIANAMQNTCYDAWPIVAPVGAVKTALKLSKQ